jgi:hypothetical protein
MAPVLDVELIAALVRSIQPPVPVRPVGPKSFPLWFEVLAATSPPRNIGGASR